MAKGIRHIQVQEVNVLDDEDIQVTIEGCMHAGWDFLTSFFIEESQYSQRNETVNMKLYKLVFVKECDGEHLKPKPTKRPSHGVPR